MSVTRTVSVTASAKGRTAVEWAVDWTGTDEQDIEDLILLGVL